jgi:hypothetical protein
MGVPTQPVPFGTEAVSHALGVQVYGVPEQLPAASQTSFLVEEFWSLQLAPAGNLALTHVPVLHTSLVQSLPSLQSAVLEQPRDVTVKVAAFEVPPSKSSTVYVVLAAPKNPATGTKRTCPVSKELNVPFPAIVTLV